MCNYEMWQDKYTKSLSLAHLYKVKAVWAVFGGTICTHIYLPCIPMLSKLWPVTAQPLWMSRQSFHPVWTELGHTQIKAVGKAHLQELDNCPFLLATAHSQQNRRPVLGTTRRTSYMNLHSPLHIPIYSLSANIQVVDLQNIPIKIFSSLTYSLK